MWKVEDLTITLDELKNDVITLDARDSFKKYILGDNNWYFENVLDISPDEIVVATKAFSKIIANEFNVNAENVIMVGSAKIGYSLAPSPKDDRESKLFKAFSVEGVERKPSDIDVAIISESLFNNFWRLLRDSFRIEYSAYYNHIPRAIYRGYINENNLQNIQGCRKQWNRVAAISKKKVQTHFFTKHIINYRIYRNWYDLEDYHIQTLRKIKREV